MKFLQAVVVLLGIAAFVFLLGEPHLEGRNIHATLFEIYFKDPFLAFAYIGSIPFFVALYQTFMLLGDVRRNTIVLPKAAKGLRTIKYCAIALIGFVVVGEVIIFLGPSDDKAGGVFMGLLVILGSIGIYGAGCWAEGWCRSQFSK